MAKENRIFDILLIIFIAIALSFIVCKAYAAEVGTCRVVSESKARHIFFTVTEGRKLLLDLKTYKHQSKVFLSIKDRKLKLQKEINDWINKKAIACDKALATQTKAIDGIVLQITKLKTINDALKKDVLKHKHQANKYALQRWQWAVITGVSAFIVGGIVGGFVVGYLKS